jgi:hypothetical protein
MGFHKTAHCSALGWGLLLRKACLRLCSSSLSQYNKLFVNVLSPPKTVAFYGVVFTLHSFHDLAFKAPTGFLAQVQLSAKLG